MFPEILMHKKEGKKSWYCQEVKVAGAVNRCSYHQILSNNSCCGGCFDLFPPYIHILYCLNVLCIIGVMETIATELAHHVKLFALLQGSQVKTNLTENISRHSYLFS